MEVPELEVQIIDRSVDLGYELIPSCSVAVIWDVEGTICSRCAVTRQIPPSISLKIILKIILTFHSVYAFGPECHGKFLRQNTPRKDGLKE
jgi:hypothetical protein